MTRSETMATSTSASCAQGEAAVGRIRARTFPAPAPRNAAATRAPRAPRAGDCGRGFSSRRNGRHRSCATRARACPGARSARCVSLGYATRLCIMLCRVCLKLSATSSSSRIVRSHSLSCPSSSRFSMMSVTSWSIFCGVTRLEAARGALDGIREADDRRLLGLRARAASSGSSPRAPPGCPPRGCS